MKEQRLAAVWFRVSTEEQQTSNQIPEVERFCDHHDLRIVRRFVLNDSAWQNGTGGAEYVAALKEVLDSAWRGEYSVVVVWALDRITRLGIEALLRIIRQLRENGAVLMSVQESWMNGSPETQDLMASVAGWMAQRESARKSEQVKIGMARARAEGKVVGGRKKGAKDLQPRRRRVAA